MRQCASCRSAYLDPRPTPETIHLAYANYYTHQEGRGKDDYATLSPLRKLRRRLVNGYTNWRYGTHAAPSSALGVLFAFALPTLKKVVDHEFRHLPERPNKSGVVLDVGCGDGSFLRRARSCGWNVVGLEPDSKAVANATALGLPVYRGGIEYFSGETELFDVITLNHVIEHVHDPVKVLETCHSLLKPGGQLWVETPNIDSLGHARFQNNWRGLETPRHLTIFNQRSLIQAFKSAGFRKPCLRTRPSACANMFKKSFALSQGRPPYEELKLPKALRLQAAGAGLLEFLFPPRREVITISAHKT